MKKYFTTLAAVVIFIANIYSQVPQKMSYQAIVRNSSNQLVTNTTIGMQVSILQGGSEGTAIYVETHAATTNINGLVTIEIGGGSVVSGTFATIDWSASTYFLKTEIDPSGGTSYSVTGTSQLLSVPYALHAKTADNGFSGDYTDLTNKPVNVSEFSNDAGYLTSYTENDPQWTSDSANYYTKTHLQTSGESQVHFNNLTNKPTTLSGYGITDAMGTSHAANGITSTNITNWDAAYGWGNHATTGYLTSYTETDPVWTTASSNYYTKTNMQTSGSAQLHFNNLTNKPTTLSGYGITDAMGTSHAANGITSTNITNWNTAYGWGNHAGLYRPVSYVPAWTDITSNPFGITSPLNNQLLKYNSTSGKWENWTPSYLTAEVDGSVTNEIELPIQTGNSGRFLTTDGSSPSWAALTKSSVGLGNVENTALSAWTGSTNITTLGTISSGTWQGSAIGASYIGNLPASQITSGTFDNARINWAAPGNIGSTTAASGAFTSLSANNGLSVSNGTVNIKPSGSGGTNGHVLTTDGAGNATWKVIPSSSLPVSTQNSNYTISASDGFIITNGACTFTLPTAASAGAGKIIYLYSKASSILLTPASGNTLWDASGNSYTNPSTISTYSSLLISDGVNTWYEVCK